uniref:Uncharacterized protein n=1 Tax=Heterorhabditis bacteriophora TaxID=37862 RepID=A0A1I7WJV4_HETBA
MFSFDLLMEDLFKFYLKVTGVHSMTWLYSAVVETATFLSRGICLSALPPSPLWEELLGTWVPSAED